MYYRVPLVDEGPWPTLFKQSAILLIDDIFFGICKRSFCRTLKVAKAKTNKQKKKTAISVFLTAKYSAQFYDLYAGISTFM